MHFSRHWDWTEGVAVRDLWHFHFYGEVPLKLVAGRERIYFEHFWNDFAADRTRSVSERDRRVLQRLMRSPAECVPDSNTSRRSSRTPRISPNSRCANCRCRCWCCRGRRHWRIPDRAGPAGRERRARRHNQGLGHWLIDEAPIRTMSELVAFLDSDAPSAALRRIAPGNLALLSIPVHRPASASRNRNKCAERRSHEERACTRSSCACTRHIEAHTHPDDRIATVVSGTWHFGYGDAFDEKKLKASPLPPGSFTEPPDRPHFARTGEQPVALQITGVGPTGTHYVTEP